jgi:ankyrin repeat protein
LTPLSVTPLPPVPLPSVAATTVNEPLSTTPSGSLLPLFPAVPTSDTVIPEFPTAPTSDTVIPDFPALPEPPHEQPPPPPLRSAVPSAVNVVQLSSSAGSYSAVAPTPIDSPSGAPRSQYTSLSPRKDLEPPGAYSVAPPAANQVPVAAQVSPGRRLESAPSTYSFGPPASDETTTAARTSSTRASSAQRSVSPPARSVERPNSSGASPELSKSPVPPPKPAVAIAAMARTSTTRARTSATAAPMAVAAAAASASDVEQNAKLVSELDRKSINEHATFWRRPTQVPFAVPANVSLGHARRDAVVRSLLEKELVVLLVLRDAVSASDRDDLCEALVLLLEPFNVALYTIEAVIAVEVAGTLSEGTLFRSNSVASKMMSCYAKRLPDGANYLRAVLEPLVRDVCSGRYSSLEVNPDYVRADAANSSDDPARNMQTLIQLANSFLSAILDALHTMPVGLQHLCAHLRACVQQRFAAHAGSTAVLTTMGGFLFLRFFCPAIVAPEQHGIIDEAPHRDVRRILVLVSKALQNLANRTAFREKYMGPMNAFLEQNHAKIVDYLQDAAVMVHSSGAVPVRQHVPDEERDAAFARVHKLAAPRVADIEARARVLFPSALDTALHQVSTFASAMADLGAPQSAGSGVAGAGAANALAPSLEAKLPKRDTAGVAGFWSRITGRASERRNVRETNALFHALQLGDDAAALQLLTKNEDLLSAQNEVDGATPIIAAANAGNAALVKYLLEQKADLFLADKNGWTVLHAGCFSKRDDIVEVLLNESHIDVAAKNEDGNTPLHYFARNRHDPAVARRLLRTFATRGADLNARNNIGEVPLHAACWKGNVPMAQALLRAGASALLRSDAGQSARTIARLTNNAELDAVLDEAGAPAHELDRKAELATAPDSPRGHGLASSPRPTAQQQQQQQQQQPSPPVTAQQQASPTLAPQHSRSGSGRAPPLAAIAIPAEDLATMRDSTLLQSTASTGTQQFLADVAALRSSAVRNALAGASCEMLLRASGAHGATALHLLAASGGDLRAVSLTEHIVKLGADVNAVDDGGFTPTSLAVYRNNQPVLRMLMTSVAVDIGIANTGGNTALHYLHRLMPVDLLLVRSVVQIASLVLLDAPNKNGDTPLLLAAASGANDVCELLLAGGASCEVRNAAGQTAVDVAEQTGRSDLTMLLRNARDAAQEQDRLAVVGTGTYAVVNAVPANSDYQTKLDESAESNALLAAGYMAVGYELVPDERAVAYDTPPAPNGEGEV